MVSTARKKKGRPRLGKGRLAGVPGNVPNLWTISSKKGRKKSKLVSPLQPRATRKGSALGEETSSSGEGKVCTWLLLIIIVKRGKGDHGNV